jgi:hypothetical protein
MFFSNPAVRAIFRNMATWMEGNVESTSETTVVADRYNDWYTLPGPAEWWSDDYDYERFGFDVELDIDGKYQRAFEMIYEDTPSQAFDMLLPGSDELMTRTNTKETAFLLKPFN